MHAPCVVRVQRLNTALGVSKAYSPSSEFSNYTTGYHDPAVRLMHYLIVL
jgi:hypothetical protein